MSQSNYNNIILFDGVCSLCNRSVVFILENEKHAIFRFASIQSDIGQEILMHYGKQMSEAQSLNSVYLVLSNKLLDKSNAALQIARKLKFPHNLLYIGILIPKFIRDGMYNYIAKHRYKWFGKNEMCAIPKPIWKHRIIS